MIPNVDGLDEMGNWNTEGLKYPNEIPNTRMTKIYLKKIRV